MTEQTSNLPCHMETIKRKVCTIFQIVTTSCNPICTISIYYQLLNGWIILKVFDEKVLKRLPKWLVPFMYEMAFILQSYSFPIDSPALLNCGYFLFFSLFSFTLTFYKQTIDLYK